MDTAERSPGARLAGFAGVDTAERSPGARLAGRSWADGAELRIGFVEPVAADAVRVLVNGAEVAVGGSGTRLTAAVPAAVLAAYGEGRVVIALERVAGDAPRLLTLELADPAQPGAGDRAGEGNG